MSDAGDLDLNTLNDEELVQQVHDDLYDGLKEEGCTNVSAWVPVRNERAMRFFEHAGFKREMTSLKTVPVGTARLEEIRLKRALA